MGNAKENGRGQEKDEEAEAAWSQFLVKIAKVPPKPLEPVAGLRIGIIHRNAVGFGVTRRR